MERELGLCFVRFNNYFAPILSPIEKIHPTWYWETVSLCIQLTQTVRLENWDLDAEKINVQQTTVPNLQKDGYLTLFPQSHMWWVYEEPTFLQSWRSVGVGPNVDRCKLYINRLIFEHWIFLYCRLKSKTFIISTWSWELMDTDSRWLKVFFLQLTWAIEPYIFNFLSFFTIYFIFGITNLRSSFHYQAIAWIEFQKLPCSVQQVIWGKYPTLVPIYVTWTLPSLPVCYHALQFLNSA